MAGPAGRTIGALLARRGRPVCVAHAGGDQVHPHSTMFAYAESVAQGAHALELDVQLSADGVLVVQHDETVDKTTEATGPVIERTLTQLQALDNAYWYSPGGWPRRDLPADRYVYRGVRTGAVPPPPGYRADDFRVATLREVALRFTDRPLSIEIKGEELVDPLLVAEALARELVELDRLESTIVASFDSAVVEVFHRRLPPVAVSPGCDRRAARCHA